MLVSVGTPQGIHKPASPHCDSDTARAPSTVHWHAPMSCLCIGGDGFGRGALPLVVHPGCLMLDLRDVRKQARRGRGLTPRRTGRWRESRLFRRHRPGWMRRREPTPARAECELCWSVNRKRVQGLGRGDALRTAPTLIDAGGPRPVAARARGARALARVAFRRRSGPRSRGRASAPRCSRMFRSGRSGRSSLRSGGVTDVRLAHELLIGPVMYRLLYSGQPLDDGLSSRVADAVLRAFPPQ
jgi:hypothetical protein